MSHYGRRAADGAGWSEQNSGSCGNLATRCGKLTGILFLVIAFVAVHVAVAVAGPPSGNWTQTLNEEFSANGLNTALWTPEWPSGAVSGQCTSPSLVSQPGNGYLYLQVRAQESTCGGTKHSDTGALVESNPADGKSGHTGFLYTYGYVEWSVYIVGWGGEAQGCPKGGCIPDWPALWSFPENEENEIDTMEGLHGKACHTWHHHVSPIEETQGCQSGSYAGWHTYGVDWEPGKLTFYYDGAKVGEEVKSSYINSTPQYLIMDDTPPGSYGGELVVPDEIVIDYVRVWQHLPIVTTSAATGKQPQQATLNGTVNSNGTTLSNCHFEYGPSTSYGSSVPCSGPESGESATASLSPGTAYHFRIVATNASGTAYGNDETFTTPGPVEAVTEVATGVQQTEAVLNGTVNPRGYDAKYYFQYGETTAYGASTPESDAGAGSGSEPEKATITGLVPGTMYHYRLVATSGGVTNYGLDQIVATAETSSTVEYKPNGETLVWYVNSSNAIAYWLNSGEKWYPGELGGKVAAGTSPAVEYKPNGETLVWYVNSSGAIAYWLNPGGEKWYPGELGGKVAAGTSPTVEYKPNGQTLVYYITSTKGVAYLLNYAEGKWSSGEFGGKAAEGTSPTAQYKPNGETLVWYVNSSNAIAYWLNSGEKWYPGELGGKVAAGTSPTVEYKPNGQTLVYYITSTKGVAYLLNYAEGKWSSGEFGGKAAEGTSPTAQYKPNGETLVWYVNSSNAIAYWLNSGEKWYPGELGGKIATAGTVPAMEYKPNGQTLVYYVSNSTKVMSYWLNYEEGKWSNGEL